MTPKEYADYLSGKYNTNCPIKLLENLGAIVVSVPLVDIKGFYQFYEGQHIVYVNSLLSEYEQNFVLAHELGHMMMHRKQNALILERQIASSLDKYEQQANAFAVELLLGDQIIKENPEYSLYELAHMYGVPEDLLNLKKIKLS